MKKRYLFSKISEDAPVNAIGSGAIAGTGVPLAGKASNWSEPAISTKQQKKRVKLLRRKTPLQEDEDNFFKTASKAITQVVNTSKKEDLKITTPVSTLGIRAEETKRGKFAGADTFLVSPDKFANARLSRRKGAHWSKYIGEDQVGNEIREYYKSNKGKKPIILQCERTGAMHYAHFGANNGNRRFKGR